MLTTWLAAEAWVNRILTIITCNYWCGSLRFHLFFFFLLGNYHTTQKKYQQKENSWWLKLSTFQTNDILEICWRVRSFSLSWSFAEIQNMVFEERKIRWKAIKKHVRCQTLHLVGMWHCTKVDQQVVWQDS